LARSNILQQNLPFCEEAVVANTMSAPGGMKPNRDETTSVDGAGKYSDSEQIYHLDMSPVSDFASSSCESLTERTAISDVRISEERQPSGI
jgi:hypothetical protein